MKKILLIGLNYQSYTEQIIAELRTQGHEVTFHDIQPGYLLKILRRLAPRLYIQQLNRHHAKILEVERGRRYDLVLFIQVHQMTPENLTEFRREFEDAEFVLYNWDAITNHDYRPYLHLFNRVYTFDPQDARVLGVSYLPLFCIRAFQGLRRRANGPDTIYFVGNIVSLHRYDAIQAFKQYCLRERIEFKFYMRCSTYVLTLLLRSRILPRKISLRSIPLPEFIDMIETSSAVFDFSNHRQSGQTMRIMENLCAGKKIVTSDQCIRDAPYFSDDRIHVFDGLDFTGVKEFLARPLHSPDELFSEFHLSTFVSRLIDSSPRSENSSKELG